MAANLWWQPSAPDPSSNDYLALLGDSYAEGVGDWKAQQIDFTSPSHSADVIHDLTGRNILSYGRRGASSAEGLVRLPALALGAGECLFFPSLRPPQEIVYYFYEGNDLEDNIDFMSRRLGLGVGDVGVSNASIKFLEKNWGTPGRKPCFLYFGKSIKSFIKTARETFFPPPDVNSGGTETPHVANRALIGTEVVALPAALQGPGLDLDEQSVAAAFEVFEVSLMWLRQTLPDIKITVVHLPSVLSTYNLASPSVTVEAPDKSSTVHRSLDVASRSNKICGRLRDITLGSGAHFFDARPSMRELGTREIIHGPRDWTHFNRAGYTRLGETVAAALMDKAPSDHCGRLANIEHSEMMQSSQ
tara:strand:- start:9275 stop:10354 length:1080 start_codon:yes stop_codon:yes gene_type:complete